MNLFQKFVTSLPQFAKHSPHGKIFLGVRSALPELIKDYEVNSKKYAEDAQLPPPEPIDYTALGYIPEQATGFCFFLSRYELRLEFINQMKKIFLRMIALFCQQMGGQWSNG